MPIKIFDASGQVNTGRPLLGGAQAPQIPMGVDTGMGELGQGMRELGAALSQIQMQREAARKADDFAVAKVGIQRGVMGLEQEFAQDEQPETVPERFQQRAQRWRDEFVKGIADDDVRQRITPLLELNIAKQDIEIRKAAIKRETAKRTALLDNDTDFYMNQAINAQDDAGASGAVNDFALRLQGMSAFLGPEETQKRFGKFGEDVQFYRARNALRASAGSPQTLREILAKTPDLSPRRRDELVEFSDTEQRAALAKVERAEREAEKSLREQQEMNFLNRLEMIEAGTYSPEMYQKDKRSGALSPGQLGTAFKSISRSEREPTQDDIREAVDILTQPGLSSQEQRERIAEMAPRLGKQFKGFYEQASKGDGPYMTAEFRQAKEWLGILHERSPFDIPSTDTLIRKQMDEQELVARVRAGETPTQAFMKIRESRRGAEQSEEALQRAYDNAKASPPIVDGKPDLNKQAENVARTRKALERFRALKEIDAMTNKGNK